jgi:hypothetical protein
MIGYGAFFLKSINAEKEKNAYTWSLYGEIYA